MKLLAGTLCENKQKRPGFSQHGHDRADPHPAQRQGAPQLNYAPAAAVNKLSGRPELRGAQGPQDSLSWRKRGPRAKTNKQGPSSGTMVQKTQQKGK